jgi:hypothetical protein
MFELISDAIQYNVISCWIETNTPCFETPKLFYTRSNLWHLWAIRSASCWDTEYFILDWPSLNKGLRFISSRIECTEFSQDLTQWIHCVDCDSPGQCASFTFKKVITSPRRAGLHVYRSVQRKSWSARAVVWSHTERSTSTQFLPGDFKFTKLSDWYSYLDLRSLDLESGFC